LSQTPATFENLYEEQPSTETKAGLNLASRRSYQWLGIGMAGLAGISYGVQGILGKYAFEGGADVSTLLTIRFIAASLVVWLAMWFISRRSSGFPVRQPRRKTLGFFLLGLIWVTNSLFFYMGLELLPAGTAALLVYVYPALVVLWAFVLFGEKITWVKIAALVLAITGCFLTVDPAVAFAAGATFSWLGALLVFGSAFSNSWYAVLAQFFSKGTPGLVVAAYGMPVTAACFLLYVTLTGNFNFSMTAVAWLCCTAIGILTGMAVYCLLVGINIIGASRAGIVATLEPATAVLLGALLLAEPVNFAKISGGLLIVVAILLLSRNPEKKKSNSRKASM
jgi:drug/metabolite transporter (DMT)-like permease